MRASAMCEAAGVPSSSIVCDGFLGLASATAVGQGMPNLPVAVMPGHPGVQSKEELRRNVLETTLPKVVENLLSLPADSVAEEESTGHDVIYTGSLDEIQEYFLRNELSDGLPVIPPTLERIKAFLQFTDRSPEECLGILLPDNRPATIWSIAVNGVMAGCRPEYMPILVAVIEAMADPYFGVEHSGSTPGSDTLIMLNGPIIKELGFNFTQGAMRDGFQANTSIGRFWRLYLRNIAGFLPHRNDKATFGNTWRVVVAENEDVVREIGWKPNSVEMGFNEGANTITVARYTGGNHISSVSGSTPEQMMPYLSDAMLRQYSWQLGFTVDFAGSLRPLVLLSPILAETIASGGWSKQDFKDALYRDARLPAWQFERILRDWTQKPNWNLARQAKLGYLPQVYHESDDPERLVPIVWDADDYMVMVTGDLGRNSAYIFAHQGLLGYPTAKEIKLPVSWKTLRFDKKGQH